jgi:hypothetical protein
VREAVPPINFKLKKKACNSSQLGELLTGKEGKSNPSFKLKKNKSCQRRWVWQLSSEL